MNISPRHFDPPSVQRRNLAARPVVDVEEQVNRLGEEAARLLIEIARLSECTLDVAAEGILAEARCIEGK